MAVKLKFSLPWAWFWTSACLIVFGIASFSCGSSTDVGTRDGNLAFITVACTVGYVLFGLGVSFLFGLLCGFSWSTDAAYKCIQYAKARCKRYRQKHQGNDYQDGLSDAGRASLPLSHSPAPLFNGLGCDELNLKELGAGEQSGKGRS